MQLYLRIPSLDLFFHRLTILALILFSNDILHLHTPAATNSNHAGRSGSSASRKPPPAAPSESTRSSALGEVHPLHSPSLGAPGATPSARLLFHLQVEAQTAELTCREERGSPLASLLLQGLSLNVKVGAAEEGEEGEESISTPVCHLVVSLR